MIENIAEIIHLHIIRVEGGSQNPAGVFTAVSEGAAYLSMAMAVIE